MSGRGSAIQKILDGGDATLLDLVDHVLDKGVVIEGHIVLGLAGVDLVYLRLSAVLAAADRILGDAAAGAPRRHAS